MNEPISFVIRRTAKGDITTVYCGTDNVAAEEAYDKAVGSLKEGEGHAAIYRNARPTKRQSALKRKPIKIHDHSETDRKKQLAEQAARQAESSSAADKNPMAWLKDEQASSAKRQQALKATELQSRRAHYKKATSGEGGAADPMAWLKAEQEDHKKRAEARKAKPTSESKPKKSSEKPADKPEK